MRIESLAYSDFRNYEHLELRGLGKLTIFIGRNAVGKTNILEGIQLLTSASSFRHPQIAQLVRQGAEGAHIEMNATDGNRLITTALMLEPGKKRFAVNGKAKVSADVRGILPSVMFTPDDLQLAKKSSSVKRDALDSLGNQLARNYYIVRRDYEKMLRNKNRLLKDEAPRMLLESVNDTLVICGAQLFCFRLALFNRILVHAATNYGALASAGEAFSAAYKPSWEKVSGEGLLSDPSDFAAALEARPPSQPAYLSEDNAPLRDVVRQLLREHLAYYMELERSRHRSLIGPHNDQISFSLDGRDVATYASQGQQRSVVLAWKLAEVAITREILGVSPVLLLDDVLSELDGMRREMLVRFVTDDIQTFVTATDLDGFHDSLLTRAQVISLPLS